jgi:ferredoxin--NADP+ reductase
VQAALHRVLSVRPLSPLAFLLRLERGTMEFQPGQYMRLAVPGLPAQREYSVYSAPGEPFLELLIREMPGGLLSPRLRRCRPGEALEVEGPFGEFLLPGGDPRRGLSGAFLFVATGTGVAPFHCFARSHPGLDYLLLHGVARSSELYGAADFEVDRILPCLSREQVGRGQGGTFAGRVTDFLRAHLPEPERLCYLCGGCDMIYEVFATLRRQGVPAERVFAEVYF